MSISGGREEVEGKIGRDKLVVDGETTVVPEIALVVDGEGDSGEAVSGDWELTREGFTLVDEGLTPVNDETTLFCDKPVLVDEMAPVGEVIFDGELTPVRDGTVFVGELTPVRDGTVFVRELTSVRDGTVFDRELTPV
jgi:hypothetical protein